MTPTNFRVRPLSGGDSGAAPVTRPGRRRPRQHINSSVLLVKEGPLMLLALCRVLAAPLRQLAGAFDGLGTRLKSGDTGAVTALENQFTGISAASVKGGAPITERTDQNAG